VVHHTNSATGHQTPHNQVPNHHNNQVHTQRPAQHTQISNHHNQVPTTRPTQHTQVPNHHNHQTPATNTNHHNQGSNHQNHQTPSTSVNHHNQGSNHHNPPHGTTTGHHNPLQGAVTGIIKGSHNPIVTTVLEHLPGHHKPPHDTTTGGHHKPPHDTTTGHNKPPHDTTIGGHHKPPHDTTTAGHNKPPHDTTTGGHHKPPHDTTTDHHDPHPDPRGGHNKPPKNTDKPPRDPHHYSGENPVQAHTMNAPANYPHYSQGDPQWKGQSLGNSGESIGAAGCLMSSVASMVAGRGGQVNGAAPNPATMNQWLKSNGGFQGPNFVWDSLKPLGFNFENIVGGNKDTITNALSSGKNVLLHVNNGHHYVLATGVTPTGYTVMDPGYPRTEYSFGEVSEAGIYNHN